MLRFLVLPLTFALALSPEVASAALDPGLLSDFEDGTLQGWSPPMQSVYDRWNHGTHKAVATCNDCHTPEVLYGKYIVKAINGWNHSVAFTTGNFPEPLRITGFNKKVTQLQCLKCHSALVSSVMRFHGKEEMNCLTCHSGVGHGR